MRNLLRIATRDFERTTATPHISGPAFDDVRAIVRDIAHRKARAAAEWAAVYGEVNYG